MGIGVAYLAAVAYLASPVLERSSTEATSSVRFRFAPAGRPVGIAPLGQVRGVPARWPGAKVTQPEYAVTAAESFEGSEAAAAESASTETEAGSEPTTHSEAGSNPPAPSEGGGGEHSVIGFEG